MKITQAAGFGILAVSILASLPGAATPKAHHAAIPARCSIRVLRAPAYGSGEDSHGTISGTASGPGVDGLKVVVYAVTDMAYVQPYAVDPLTTIAGGKWSTGTHYVCLLVKPSFQPPAVAGDVPAVGGDVLAEIRAEPGR